MEKNPKNLKKEIINAVIDEVMCKNCGISAKDYFDMIMEKIPLWIMLVAAWYCCQECYEEDTQHEG